MNHPNQQRFFTFIARRPVTIFMVALSLLVFGYVSYQRLPLTLMPDIYYPRITLRTEYPGASPYEVESLISEPIEQSLGILPNLNKITSVSYAGYSEVICEFSWDTDVQAMILNMREKLDRVRLPEEAERPVILRYDPSLDPVMRLAMYGKRPIEEIRYFAEEEIKREIESISGVASVVLRGGARPIISIQLKRDRLSRYQVTPAVIQSRLQEENINLAGGSLREGDVLYLVRILNEFKSVEEIEKLIVTYKDRAPVRLRDLATVKESAEEKEVMTRLWGRETVELLIYKEADANLLQVAGDVKNRVFGTPSSKGKKGGWKRSRGPQSIEKALPQEIEISLLSDTSIYVKKSIDEVKSAALWGALLAVLVLLFFLHDFKNTLIIGLSIPLSLVVTFAPMNMMGLSLNIMSLGGLALAAGLVVDNAIVVLEAIFRQQEEGHSNREAAILGTEEVASAITASTLTTIAVFFPIVFVEGIAGQIFADQSLTVTFALLVSLLVALFFIPALAALEAQRGPQRWKPLIGTLKTFHSLDKAKREWTFFTRGWRRLLLPLGILWITVKGMAFLISEIIGKILLLLAMISGVALGVGLKGLSKIARVVLWIPFQLFNLVFGTWERVYRAGLKHLLPWRGAILLVAFLLCGWSGVVFQKLGARLLPELHQGEFYQEVRLPPGTELKKTDALLARAQKHFQDEKNLFQRLSSQAGSDDEELEGLGEEGGKLYVLLEPKENLKKAEEKAIGLIRDYFSSLPDLEIMKVSKPRLLSFRTPIEVEIKGYDLKKLRQYSRFLARRLDKLEELQNVRLSLKGGNPEIRVNLQRDRLLRMGLNADTVAQLIKSQFKGEIPTVFRQEGERKDVLIRLREEDRKTIADLRRLNINPAGDHAVPLESVAQIEIAQGPQEIRRIDHSRSAIISAEVKGIDLEKAVAQIREEIDQIETPPDISVEIGGQYEEMLTSIGSLYFALLLSTFLVYVVMASLFESLAQPFVIMFTLPFAFIGVGWTLYYMNLSINVMVLIGAVMLAGIVVNNAIVLIDKINQLRAAGMGLEEAVTEASSIRMRPILMTTFTTIFGLLPLALGLGEGSELRKPLAITVIAGMISSTLLTLLLMPLTYALWEGLWEKKEKFKEEDQVSKKEAKDEISGDEREDKGE